MQVAKAEVKSYYESGFPKEVQRNKYNLKINERLKAARNRKGLSAAGVVRELKKKGISIGHSTLQGYEAAEGSLNHRYPSLRVLVDLANFYGCSLDYLFGRTDRFKTNGLNTDLKDVIESRHPITYNGNKLNRKQEEIIFAEIEAILSKTN